MTVKDLIDDLSRFQDASQVVFTPREFCGSGYPEWNGASASEDVEALPPDVVIVTLSGEFE